jgi:hypothetical protein
MSLTSNLEHITGILDAPDAGIHLFFPSHFQGVCAHIPLDFKGNPVGRRQFPDGLVSFEAVDVSVPQGDPVEPDTELVPVELVVAEVVAKSVGASFLTAVSGFSSTPMELTVSRQAPTRGWSILSISHKTSSANVSVWFSRASLMPVRSSRGSTADLVMAVA